MEKAGKLSKGQKILIGGCYLIIIIFISIIASPWLNPDDFAQFYRAFGKIGVGAGFLGCIWGIKMLLGEILKIRSSARKNK